jgi:hypothetical protein
MRECLAKQQGRWFEGATGSSAIIGDPELHPFRNSHVLSLFELFILLAVMLSQPVHFAAIPPPIII